MSRLAEAHLPLANYEKALQLSTAVVDSTGGVPLCTTALYQITAVHERMSNLVRICVGVGRASAIRV
jgi:hypothetical protein